MHNLGGTKTIHFCRSTGLSNDQWIYSRTTKEGIVVQLKRVATRLSRPSDCSQQTCGLGSAELLTAAGIF